jgi:lysozyme
MAMKTSKQGRAFIVGHEATVDHVYLDPVGVKTAWKGHTGPDINALAVGTKITKAQGERWFNEDLAEAEAIVHRGVKVELTQFMFDALVAFVFNVGPGKKGVKDGFLVLKNGRPSTMLTKINASDFDGAAAEFPKWASAKGKKLPGLVRRRAEEQAMFLSGIEEEPYEANVEADCERKAKPLHRQPGAQATAAVTTAALLNEQADKISLLAPYSDALTWIFVGLVILGLIYSLKKRDENHD